MKPQNIFFSVLTAVLFFASISFAGVVYEEVSEIKGMDFKIPGMEQTGKDIKKIYVTSDKKKEASKDNVTIIRLDKEVIWTYNAQAGFYTEMTFDNMRQLATAFTNPQMMAQMEEMAGKMEMETKSTGKKMNINGFDCEQVLITTKSGGKSMVTEQWITLDVPSEFVEFNRNFAARMKKGVKPPKNLKDMGKKMGMDSRTKKLVSEGLVIKTITDMGGMKSIIEVKNVRKTSIPSKDFDLPGGLKKMPMGGGGPYPPQGPYPPR